MTLAFAAAGALNSSTAAGNSSLVDVSGCFSSALVSAAPPPYLMIVLSFFAGLVLNVCAEKMCASRYFSSGGLGIDFWTYVCGAFNPPLTLLTVLFHIAHVLYIAGTLPWAAAGPDALVTPSGDVIPISESLTGWQRYEWFYAAVLNSGFIPFSTSTMVCGMNMLQYDGVLGRKGDPCQRYITLSAVLLCALVIATCLPAVLTHALPMAFAYLWLIAPLGVVIAALAVLVGRGLSAAGVNIDGNDSFIGLIRVVVTLCAILLFQSTFNYGVLLYGHSSSGCGYLSTIAYEYELRSLRTYFQSIVQETRRALGFASFF